MLYRHWVTIFAVLLFSIKLWPRKKFRNTETRYFWITVFSCFGLVLEDSFETMCATDPSLKFFRILLSVIGYTLRSTAALSLLLVVVPRNKVKFKYLIPALITFLVSSTAFFSDIAFGYDANYKFYRGPLGIVAFIVPIIYVLYILWIVIKYFTEKSSLEKYIMPMCIIFCLSSSAWDAIYGGVKLDESIIICSIIFYLILFSNDNRRDSLTGLLNRQAFYDDCNLFSRSIEAVASLDMNGLKDLNDTYGHLAGDEALKKIGECMLKIADEKTLAYRVGGDEFLIVFLHSNKDEIKKVIKKVTDDVTQCNYSISTGYAMRGRDDSIDDVIRESDKFMYESKAEYYRSKGLTERVSHYQLPEESIK